MSFTTSGGLRSTWRIDALDPAVFAGMFGCSKAEADERFERARRELCDPARLRELLNRMSAPALAVLNALVGAGGTAGRDTILDEVYTHFEIVEKAATRAIVELMAAVIVVPLSSGSRELLAVVDVVAGAAASLLGGLEIPVIDDDATVVPDPAHDDGRGLIAACMALRHVDLKVTQTGSPHRSGAKRLAKQLGVADAQLDGWLVVAIELGLVRADEHEVLRPAVARIRRAAAGRYPHRPELEELVRRLRSSARPLVFHAVTQWMTQVMRGYVRTGYLSPAEIGTLPGVRRGHAGDIDVLEGVTPPEATAASVTPSFEIYLPPECALDHLVDVLGCAELVRIDRVLVARATKTSIRRAVAAGATAASLIADLARASRTPLPQNVQASIIDWAGSATHATIAFGRAIAVSADAHDRASTALAPLAPTTLAPGVFVVAAEIPAVTVTKLLDKAGISVRMAAKHGAEGEDSDDASEVRGEDKPRSSVAYPAFATGDRAFQQRLAAFRAGDAAEHSRGRRPCVCGVVHDDDEHDDDADDDDADYLTVSEIAMRRVERWERDHEPLPDDVASVLAAVTDAFVPADRDFVLLAKSATDIVGRIRIVLAERDGLDRLVSTHRAAFARVLPAVMNALEHDGDRELTASAASRDVFAGQRIEWVREGIHARLTAAQRTHATLLLDLGDGAIRPARILGIRQQGTEPMLLAEDPRDRASIAVRLSSVRALAEPPPPAARNEAPSSPREATTPWRPLPGQPLPPGHSPCPCGSGQRYRTCCRSLAFPS